MGPMLQKTSFLSVISFMLPGVTNADLKNLGLAKVVKHCINKKKCSYGTCCTGTAKKLVIFVFCNSTKSRKVGVALELRLLGKSVSSFQLENDCMN